MGDFKGGRPRKTLRSGGGKKLGKAMTYAQNQKTYMENYFLKLGPDPGKMCILWSDIRIWEYVLKIFDRDLIKNECEYERKFTFDQNGKNRLRAL